MVILGGEREQNLCILVINVSSTVTIIRGCLWMDFEIRHAEKLVQLLQVDAKNQSMTVSFF